MALLGTNKPISGGAASKAGSIYPAGFATAESKVPFITIQGGPRSKVDPIFSLYDEFFYIRCYNDVRKAYVQIDEILERVESLLDGLTLSLTNGSNVHTTFEESLGETIDESLNLNFVEAHFRIRTVE